MAGGGKVLAGMADAGAASALAGRPVEEFLRELAGSSGVKVTAQDLADARKARPGLPPLPQKLLDEAIHLPPSDVRRMIPRQGSALRAQLEALAERFPAVKKKLQEGATLAGAIGTPGQPSIAARTAARAAARTSSLAVLDLQSREARALLDDAIASLPGHLQPKVQRLSQRAIAGTLESFAADVARGLGREDGPAFVRAVHERICRAIHEELLRELDDPAIRKQLERALEDAQRLAAGTPAVAPLFRAQLRGIVADAEVSALVERAAGRLEGASREAFLRAFWGSVSEEGARLVLEAHFDAEGLRRLAGAYGSFRKVYSVQRMRRAMENLVGWLYEASGFTARVVREAAEEFQRPLAAALQAHGIVAGRPLVHFDVLAPSLSGRTVRQATDALGTVPLSSSTRTVHVLACALESKGEAGVAAGVAQLERLPRRFAKGRKVTTEHGTYTVGEDLFLTVEDALAALAIPRAARRAVVDATAAKRYAAVVVSPLEEAAARARFGAVLDGSVQYRAHPVSREQMVKVAEGLAPRFSLLPLSMGTKGK